MALSSRTRITLSKWTAGFAALSLIVAVGACDPPASETPAVDSAPDVVAAPDAVSESEPPAENTVLITPTSFGDAQTCTTAEEIQAALPDLTVSEAGDGPLVDTQGVEVTDVDGNVAFYALAAAGADIAELSLFTTDNPTYQTAEGIGPRTTIEEAEAAYGDATLAYSVENESREFVRFENGPEGIDFRTGTGPEAGVYESRGGYSETTEYQPGAVIQSVWISDRSCLPDF